MMLVVETTPRAVEIKAIRCQPDSPGSDHLITIAMQGVEKMYVAGDRFHLNDILEINVPIIEILKAVLFGKPLTISPEAEREKV